MDLVVDGSIYEGPPYGRIARIYAEILPRMCELNASLAVTLLTSTHARGDVPGHGRIRHVRVPAIERTFRPERLWSPVAHRVRAAVQRAVVGEARGRIWHSAAIIQSLERHTYLIVRASDLRRFREGHPPGVRSGAILDFVHFCVMKRRASGA